MGSIPFALQLYTVRDHMGQDAAATLKRVKEIGYDYVELAGTGGLSFAEFKAVLDDVGLTAIATHVGFDDATKNVDQLIETARLFGMEHVVVPGIDRALTPDKQGWINCGKAMDAGGAKLREAGVRLSYHNHNHEFEQFDGQYILDIFLGAAQPENLASELDTYWVKFGGADPVAQINKLKGRCPLLHIKDMTPGDDPTFAEVGRGIIDWAPVFAAGADAGTEWYIVEQDTCPGDSLESARISAEFMAAQ